MSGEEDNDKLSDTARIVRKFLADLTPSERDLLQKRFGLRTGKDLTIEEIGQQFIVTRERIQEFERKARAKRRIPLENPEDDPDSPPKL